MRNNPEIYIAERAPAVLLATMMFVCFVHAGCESPAESLVKGFANVRAEYDRDVPAIHQAASAGDPEKVRKLLDEGASANATTAAKRGSLTPLQFATYPVWITECFGSFEGKASKKEITARDSRCAAVCELLIARGADVNAADRNGATALAGAAACGLPRTAAVLIAHGADVKKTFEWNCSDPFVVVPHVVKTGNALYVAACTGNSEVAKVLLDHGAKDCASQAVRLAGEAADTDTPLHAAIRARDIRSIGLLIGAGADVNAVDSKGRTAFAIVQEEIRHWEKAPETSSRAWSQLGTLRRIEAILQSVKQAQGGEQ